MKDNVLSMAEYKKLKPANIVSLPDVVEWDFEVVLEVEFVQVLQFFHF